MTIHIGAGKLVCSTLFTMLIHIFWRSLIFSLTQHAKSPTLSSQITLSCFYRYANRPNALKKYDVTRNLLSDGLPDEIEISWYPLPWLWYFKQQALKLSLASYWPQVLRIDEHRTTEATLFSRRLALGRSADDQTLSGKYSNWGKGIVMRYTVWTRVSDIDTWRDHRLNDTFLIAYLKFKHFCAMTYICPGIGKK